MKIRVRDDQLRLRTSARFYQLFAPVSQRMAVAILEDIHASRGSSKPRIVRRRLGVGAKSAVVDYTIVPYEEEPPFLAGTIYREQRLGLVLLVQYEKHLCVSTAGRLSLSDKYIESLARRVGQEVMADVVADAEAIEGLGCRNMSLGNGAIRSRTFAGNDLGASLAPVMLNRQVLTSVRTRRGGAKHTTRPSTALITQSAPRATLEEFVTWVAAEIDKMQTRVANPVAKPHFLRYFAQPIKREKLPYGIQPNAVLLDLTPLEQGIVDGELGIFYLDSPRRDATPVAVPDEVALAAIKVLGEIGIVQDHPYNAITATVKFAGFSPDFTLRANKQSYSISAYDLRHVRIGDRDGSNLRTITQWLSDPEHAALFVSMSDIRFAFLHGEIFQDERIVAQAPALLTCIQSVGLLATCDSEKGSSRFVPGMTAFPGDTIFNIIETTISGENILVCDDLGDEWADYIGVDEGTHTITLYHAKHGAQAASASAFHEVFGQAVKNLGRIGAVRDDLEAKKDGWGSDYCGGKVTTSIARIRRGGTVDAVVAAYERVAAHPARRARIALVTSFLSKAEMEATVAVIEGGGQLRRNDPQRVWLMTSFVSLCRDAGAEAVIYCAP